MWKPNPISSAALEAVPSACSSQTMALCPSGSLALPARVPHPSALHRGPHPTLQEPCAFSPEEAGGRGRCFPRPVQLEWCGGPTTLHLTYTNALKPYPFSALFPCPAPATDLFPSCFFHMTSHPSSLLLHMIPSFISHLSLLCNNLCVSCPANLPSPFAMTTRLLVSRASVIVSKHTG